MPTKGSPSFMGDGVDGLPLRAAILMVDPIALVMALYETGAHKIRDRPADVASAGTTNPGAHFLVDDARRAGGIGGKRLPALEVAPDGIDNREPSCIALGHGHKGIAKPIANRHMTIGLPDIGTSAVRRTRRLRDEAQDHIGIARTPRDEGKPCEQGWKVQGLRPVCREKIGLEHSMNLAQPATM